MAENLQIAESEDRKHRYETLLPQIAALLSGETDLIANLANLSSAIQTTFGFLWVGFYRVEGDELILGPFQGPLACTRIKKGEGVCGKSWELGETIVVPNVEEFPGHIACSSRSKSEIVVPVHVNGEVRLILDIDSENLSDFSDVDRDYLEQIAFLLTTEMA